MPLLDDEILDELNDCGSLSDWETDFVDDLLRRREASDGVVMLTERQDEKLREIYEKRCE